MEQKKAAGKRQRPTVEAPIVGHSRAEEKPPDDDTGWRKPKKTSKAQDPTTPGQVNTYNHYSILDQSEGEYADQDLSSMVKGALWSDLDRNSVHTCDRQPASRSPSPQYNRHLTPRRRGLRQSKLDDNSGVEHKRGRPEAGIVGQMPTMVKKSLTDSQGTANAGRGRPELAKA